MSEALILPATVTLVCAAFAVTVASQHLRRPRPYKLNWAVALSMAAVAAGSFVAFVVDPHNDVAFRLYYLFGACLNVGYLGVGSLYLLVSRGLAQTALAAMIVLSIVEAALIFTARVDPVHAQLVSDIVLRGAPVPYSLVGHVDAAGKGVLHAGPWLVLVILIPILGTVSLVGGAFISAWRLRRPGAWSERSVSLGLLALGGIIVAVAGTGVRYGNGAGFWLLTAVGWIVLFAGFAGTHRAAARVPQRAGHRSPHPSA
ncbi:MAG: hypothetical protein NVSMB65_00060 [Chloroflexota bacterium]